MTGVTIIPAADDTNIIDRDGNAVAMVVAWQYIQSNMVFPVFAFARSGVRSDEAIWHENGKVEHPASQRMFVDIDAWTAWAEDNVTEATEEAAQSKPAVAATTKPATPASKPAATAAAATTGSLSPIKFGTKSYSTKSYWVWPDMKVIFEIEGGSVYPDDPRVEKIKRDDFAQAKRDGFDKIDPTSGVIPGDNEDQSEGQTGTDDDEDMDVV